MHIHASSLRTYMTCRRLYHWADKEHDNLEPIYKRAPLQIGTALHFVIEHLNDMPVEQAIDIFLAEERKKLLDFYGQPFECFVELSMAEIYEMMDVVCKMAAYYKIWAPNYEGPYRDDNLEIIEKELEFNVPWFVDDKGNQVYAAGVADNIMRRKDTGALLLGEYKTHAGDATTRLRSIDTEFQPLFYLVWLEQIYNTKFEGVLYTVISKETPKEPRLLKTGSLSKDTSQKTTFEQYLNYIRAMYPELDREGIKREFGEVLMALKNRPNPFIQRQLYRPSSKLLQSAKEEFTLIAKEMVSDHVIYPRTSEFCTTMCAFKAPCDLIRQRADHTDILETNYRSRTATHIRLEENNDGD